MQRAGVCNKMSDSFDNAIKEIKALRDAPKFLEENEFQINALIKKYNLLLQYENDTTINDMKLYVLAELKTILNKTCL